MIIEAEVFVYNLGTMFYVDDILYPEIISDMLKHEKDNETEILNDEQGDVAEPTTEKYIPTQPKGDVEFIGNFNGDNGKYIETIDDEVVTPRVLPVKYKIANE